MGTAEGLEQEKDSNCRMNRPGDGTRPAQEFEE